MLLASSAPDCKFVSASGEHHARSRPHKGVAANPLARLGGLQQESILLPDSDAKKCAHRCQQIGAEGLGHRNESGVAAKLQKTLVIGCDHRVSGGNRWVNWDYTRGANAMILLRSIRALHILVRFARSTASIRTLPMSPRTSAVYRDRWRVLYGNCAYARTGKKPLGITGSTI